MTKTSFHSYHRWPMYRLGWRQSSLPVSAERAANWLGLACSTTPSRTIIVPIHRLPPDRMPPAVRSASTSGKEDRHFSAPVWKSRPTISDPSIRATTLPSAAMFSDGSSLGGVMPPCISFHLM